MSRAESFLRGGTPCTEVPELIEVLSSAGMTYTHWRFVAYYPQRWHHDDIENRTTAPLYFLAFAACAGKAAAHNAGSPLDSAVRKKQECSGAASPSQTDNTAWHLLCYTMLPNGAIPHESFQFDGLNNSGNGGGGSGDLRESVTSGGGGVGALRTLLRTIPASLHPSTSLEWFSVADGLAYRRMGLMSEPVFEDTVAPAVAEVLSRYWKPGCHVVVGEERQDGATAVTSAYYVHDGLCASTIHFVRESALSAYHLVKRAAAGTAMQPFVEVVRAAVQWMSSASTAMRAFTTDASVPPLPDEEHAGASRRTPLVDPKTLTGLAKLRAERDAGIAQWKEKVGEYVSFTVSDCPASSSSTRPFQHAILLQRPIEEKRRIDVDNRDPGPLAPQPIGAELHLLQDRGDVQYALEQLGNRSNLHFLYSDTLPEDGEVLVQLTPVEGTPFCDLEAYFQSVPKDAPVFHSAPASRCAGSCCGVVVPRVLYRRPSGKVQKANAIAMAQAGVEVLPPTMEMVEAAVAALNFLGMHVEKISEVVSQSTPSPSSGLAASPSNALPSPGYTLKVPPVDLSVVPPKKCGWCGRRREVLLRCGSCKTVLYCCKRHQQLDWKEGPHKIECNLWRHARELHERVVERWAASASSTWRIPELAGNIQEEVGQKGRGWSCAATLTQFIKDIEAGISHRGAQRPGDSGSGDVWRIYVAGFESSCLDEFLRSSCTHFSHLSDGARQYRILLCTDTFDDVQRNAVWAVRRSPRPDGQRLWLTGSTGVLGDSWHCKGINEEESLPAACVALIRCCGVKYHNIERGSGGSSSINGGTVSGLGEEPSAVLSFGPFNGEGCTYLNAALEVFAGHDVGIVPLRLVDSSYVGAVRTRDALLSRISNSDVCAAATKARASELVMHAKAKESAEVTEDTAPTRTASGGPHRPFQILFNDVGAVAPEVTAAAPTTNGVDGACGAAPAAASETRETRVGSAVPHYINSYVFSVYPSDF